MKQLLVSHYGHVHTIPLLFTKIKEQHTFDGVVLNVLLIGLVLLLCMKVLLLEVSGQNQAEEPTTSVYQRHLNIGLLERGHPPIKHFFTELNIIRAIIHHLLILLHLVQCALLSISQQQS